MENEPKVPVAQKVISHPVATVQLQNNTSRNQVTEEPTITTPEPPIKASGKNPVIQILIDPASFKELMVYDNLKFEVIGGDKWDPRDSDIEWQDVKLQTVTVGKVYRITFSKSDKTVSYIVNPVLEGKDFEKAQKEYDAKLAEYEQQIMQKKNEFDSIQKIEANLKYSALKDTSPVNRPFQLRLSNDSLKSEKTVATGYWMIKDTHNTSTYSSFFTTINPPQNKLNFSIAENTLMNFNQTDLELLIAKRNEAIEKRKKEMEDENKRILAQIERNSFFIDSIRKAQDSMNQIQTKMYNLQQDMVRSFTIDGFGYWNCDQPTIPSGHVFVANFKNDEGKPFTFSYMNGASFGVNRLLAYYNNTITVLPNVNHVMWTFKDGHLYYLTIDDYEKLNITSTTKNVNIQLRKYKGSANSIDALKNEIFYVKNSKSYN